MFGASGTSLLEPGSWELSMGFRYQKSFRHFVGTEEQPTRATAATQVINHQYMLDLGMTYAIDERHTVTIAVPFLVSTRSQTVGALATEPGPEGRYRQETSARGMGDLSVTGRRWMFDPAKCPDGNLALGLGIKLPTGKPN